MYEHSLWHRYFRSVKRRRAENWTKLSTFFVCLNDRKVDGSVGRIRRKVVDCNNVGVIVDNLVIHGENT